MFYSNLINFEAGNVDKALQSSLKFITSQWALILFFFFVTMIPFDKEKWKWVSNAVRYEIKTISESLSKLVYEKWTYAKPGSLTFNG